MKREKPAPEPEHKEFAPLWITTFADLVGQLFAFFVMLLVMGKMQEAGMMGAVRESFVSSMKNFGYAGTLYGRDKLAGPHDKPTYAVKDPEPTDERTLDAKESEKQALYQNILKSVEATNGRLEATQITYLPKGIHFARSRSELSDEDKALLTNDMAELKATLAEKNVKLYVLGLAAEEPTEWQQWAISAKRAETVAAYMRGLLPDGLNWQVYSWGAGKGGEWTAREGQATKEAHILVAVLRE
jgi:outer membrane protein OmpA-like peptidoglycan-associated protein